MRLELNQEKKFVIKARKPWNKTELEIQPGEKYRFEGIGQWHDLTFPSDANGYTNNYMSRFDRRKRSKENLWFALMGSLNKKESFLIGTQAEIEFSESGALYCYANDVKGLYWNNFGSISLTIKRLK